MCCLRNAVSIGVLTIRAQEAQVEQIHLYEDQKGIVYLNEAFHINEDNGPVRILKVTVRHIPKKTAVIADAYYDGLFRYLKDHDKQRLRQLSKENLTITIDADRESVVAVKFESSFTMHSRNSLAPNRHHYGRTDGRNAMELQPHLSI